MTNPLEEEMKAKFEAIRPDHPDLARLSKVINNYTNAISEDSDSQAIYMAYLDGYCDLDSLSYASIQRAITLAGLNPNLLNLLSAMWLEGFITCILYQQEPHIPEPAPSESSAQEDEGGGKDTQDGP